MVPTEGVEPTRPRGHQILSLARLPIPPRRHKAAEYKNRCSRSKRDYSGSSALGGPRIIEATIACRTAFGLGNDDMNCATSWRVRAIASLAPPFGGVRSSNPLGASGSGQRREQIRAST